MATGAFSFKLQGSAAVNRDATIRLTNESTGAVLERKTFLDGTLTMRDLPAGGYQMEVLHPNLIQPIDRRRIVLFPQPAPTFVPIPVPAHLFQDTAIRDIPDANLTPVQQAAASVRERLAPLGAKSPGEAIRAADWNAMVGAVSDLAGAIGELTQLVAPQGHNHPEIGEKIDEVQENLRRFAEAFGKSLLELRRELEMQYLHGNLLEAFTTLQSRGVAVNEDIKTRLLTHVTDLQTATQSDSSVFTRKLAAAGTQIVQELTQLAAQPGVDPAAFGEKTVSELQAVAAQYSQSGQQSRGESELNTYKITSGISGRKLAAVRR